MEDQHDGRTESADRQEPPTSAVIPEYKGPRGSQTTAKAKHKPPQPQTQATPAKEQLDRDLVRWTRALAFFTAALVIAAGLQFWAMRGQLQEMTSARESGDKATAEQMAVMQAQAKTMQGQLQMMEHQIMDQRKIQRAFITVTRYKVIKTEDDASGKACWNFDPIIANAGDTPAMDMRYAARIIAMELPLPGKQGSANGMVFAPTDPEDFFRKYEVESMSDLGPKQQLADIAGISKVCLSSEDRGSIWAPERIYARGVIHYRDVFPGSPSHITKYCFWVQAETENGTFKPRVVPCSHWNCSDAECEKDKEDYKAELAEDFAKTGQAPMPPIEFFPQ